MAAVWMCLRAELRTRWLGIAGVALLIGVAGGAVLTAAAGARRTDTTLARVVRAQRLPDLLVNPDNSDRSPRYQAAWKAIDALPEVQEIATIDGVGAVSLDADGNPIEGIAVDAQAIADSTGNLLHSIDRPRLVDGRFPDPDRADEILINEVQARHANLAAGSRLRIGIFAMEDFEAAPPGEMPKPRVADDFVVAGVGRTLDDASRAPDDPNLIPTVVFTPALQRKISSFAPPYIGKAVVLKHGARDVAAFEAGVRRVFTGVEYDGEPVNMNFQETSLTVARARRAVRPYVLALWLFAVLAAFAALAVIGQAIVRSARSLREARAELGALGFTDRQLMQYGALRGLVMGVSGGVVAVAIAVAASPFMPIGPLRRADPQRGLHIDGLTLGIGWLVICVLVACAAAFSTRRRSAAARRQGVATSDRLARSGLSVSVVSGVRFAFDRGKDRSVPLRSTLVGITVAVAALVGALVYGANLTHFTSTPTRYGWPWTYEVVVDDLGDDPVATMKAIEHDITETPGITEAAPALYSQFDVNGRSLAAIGVDAEPGVPFLPILSGRAPVNDHEIVFGAKSLHAIGAHIGDTVRVTVQNHAGDFQVVGTAVFPRFVPYSGSEPTGLGIGAATTARAIRTLGAELGQPFFLVGAEPGAHPTPDQLSEQLFHGDIELGSVRGPQRPNDVLSYDRLSTTPLLLAGVLLLLALGSTIHLLVTSARSRRRDIAILKTIGFTRAQARSAVLVQATVLVGIAIAFSIPLGILMGRWLWIETAHWLGIASTQSIPALALGAIVAVAIGAANLIALGPATIAARARPAIALQAE